MKIELSVNEIFDQHNFSRVAKQIHKEAFFLSKDREYFEKDGSVANWAMDCRHPLSKSTISRYVCERISNYLDRSSYRTLAVSGFGGFLLGSGIIQYGSHKNLLLIRDKKKQYGYKNIVEGNAPKNEKVCVIDDLLSSGDSMNKAVNILRKEGYEVDRGLAVFKHSWVNQIHIDNFQYEYIISVKVT